MSWDSYIDNLIAQSGSHASRAAIIGIDGSIWTTSAHPAAIAIQTQEAATLGKTFSSKDFSGFQAAGIVLEGQKYQFLREIDDKIVLGKKKNVGSITAQASKTAVVIAITPEGKSQGDTNKAVAVIAEYLESLGM